jgi:hypothetical protein
MAEMYKNDPLKATLRNFEVFFLRPCRSVEEEWGLAKLSLVQSL